MSSDTSVTALKPETSARVHLDYLDGIRGLAALYVMAYHTITRPFQSSARTGWKWLLVDWAFYGHLAVDVFIVLSGFCLIFPVVRSGGLKSGYLRFFAKRARRILPPYYMALLFSVMLFFITRSISDDGWWHQPLPYLAHALLLDTLLVQDLREHYAEIFDLPLWTVAVEWKIYFLFPLLVWLWQRRGNVAVSIAGLLITIAVTLVYVYPLRVAVLDHACPWYVLLFSLGVCGGSLAFGPKLTVRQIKAVWILFVLALLASWLVVSPPAWLRMPLPPLPSWSLADALVGTCTAAALVLLSLPEARRWQVSRILTWRPLVNVGIFAYSLYLTHYPLHDLMIILTNFLPHMTVHKQLVLLILVGFPLQVGFAYLFHLCFERPFMTQHKNETPAEVARDAALAPAP